MTIAESVSFCCPWVSWTYYSNCVSNTVSDWRRRVSFWRGLGVKWVPRYDCCWLSISVQVSTSSLRLVLRTLLDIPNTLYDLSLALEVISRVHVTTECDIFVVIVQMSLKNELTTTLKLRRSSYRAMKAYGRYIYVNIRRTANGFITWILDDWWSCWLLFCCPVPCSRGFAGLFPRLECTPQT